MQDKFDVIFKEVDKVLVVVAHPDDADAMFGGTLARLIESGRNVRILVCTNGAMGSRQNVIPEIELAKIREQEQQIAISHLGINKDQLFILDNNDGTISTYDPKLMEQIVFHLREFRPQIVLTHDPEVLFHKIGSKFGINHRDHRTVGSCTVDAVMPFSRDVSFFGNHIEKGLMGINVLKILLASDFDENNMIDISMQLEKKRSALLSHQSQLDTDVVNSILESGKLKENDVYVERFRFIELEY